MALLMSTTFTIDTSTSRANPTPAPMKRLTVPAIRARKANGKTEQPIVMLTAYTARMAQLLDPHCDVLLVGDSLGRSEEHTSELQSLMRISYAVFCLKKKTQ